MVILKIEIASKYCVNLNFYYTKYLGNARSDLHEVFLQPVRLLELFLIISKLKIWC